MWIGHCIELVHDRTRDGNVAGGSWENQKHGDREGAMPTARETSLFKWVSYCLRYRGIHRLTSIISAG